MGVRLIPMCLVSGWWPVDNPQGCDTWHGRCWLPAVCKPNAVICFKPYHKRVSVDSGTGQMTDERGEQSGMGGREAQTRV